jgi:hypothetical protein
MRALGAVLEQHGLPQALYTDRAGWAVYTPTSGSAPDRTRLTQVGRALHQLGIEHILGYSPAAARSCPASRVASGWRRHGSSRCAPMGSRLGRHQQRRVRAGSFGNSWAHRANRVASDVTYPPA